MIKHPNLFVPAQQREDYNVGPQMSGRIKQAILNLRDRQEISWTI